MSESPDEQPKRKIAKKVVAEKRRYFVPDRAVSVEAGSVEEAVELANKQSNNEVDSDG